jgi:hypothetical protein
LRPIGGAMHSPVKQRAINQERDIRIPFIENDAALARGVIRALRAGRFAADYLAQGADTLELATAEAWGRQQGLMNVETKFGRTCQC